MTHLTNKNPFKNQGLATKMASVASVASVLARKNRLKSMTCHKWQLWQGKNGVAWILASKKRKKRVKENVNEM